MKALFGLLAITAALVTGCGAAQASPEPPSTNIVSTTDHLRPTGTAVPCDPSDCDPDEGEEISPEELAEINASLAEPVLPQSVETTPPPVVFPEDSDDWNCYADGNRICGPATEGLAVEAWDAFDPSVFPADKLAQAFKVTYHGTTQAGGDLPPSEFHTVASSNPDLVHVFTVEFTK